jgi:aryl-alcohol dehydrogenase-like predicted oxidoreductase
MVHTPNPDHSLLPRVRLGNSDLDVSPVALGTWPMAGVSSLGVDDATSVATIKRAIELGINMIDTAFAYGVDGRSDRVIAQAISGMRSNVVIASKVGGSLDIHGRWKADGRPERLIAQAEQILERLQVSSVDLMYLHAPDPEVPLAEAADAVAEIVARGWARYAGVSNVTLDQASLFHSRCPIIAIQTYFNLLQPQSVDALSEFCRRHCIGLVVYWVLMKGVLAGKLQRQHRLDPADRRLNYSIYQGEKWELAQDMLDELRANAHLKNCTVAQLVSAWTLHHPSIAVALVGAKRSDQIEDTAQAMNIRFDPGEWEAIEAVAIRFRSMSDWSK